MTLSSFPFWNFSMRIPARYAHILFAALLSAIMVCICSCIVLLVNQGLVQGFAMLWLKAVITTWPLTFPIVLIVAPLVRRLVTLMTEAPQSPS